MNRENKHRVFVNTLSPEAETIMSAFWRRYAPYWHICMAVLWLAVFGIMWYQTVNNAVAQTNKNATAISTLQTQFSAMDQKITDIHDWLSAQRGVHR